MKERQNTVQLIWLQGVCDFKHCLNRTELAEQSFCLLEFCVWRDISTTEKLLMCSSGQTLAWRISDALFPASAPQAGYHHLAVPLNQDSFCSSCSFRLHSWHPPDSVEKSNLEIFPFGPPASPVLRCWDCNSNLWLPQQQVTPLRNPMCLPLMGDFMAASTMPTRS